MALKQVRPKEWQEQAFLFQWRDQVVGREPRLAYLYAIPNGEARPAQLVRSRQTGHLHRVSRVGQKLKAMGLTPGIPDLFLAWAMPHYHGFYIELKRSGISRTQEWAACSAAEQEWLSLLGGAGYKTMVCSGWVAAARALCSYLGAEYLQPEE